MASSRPPSVPSKFSTWTVVAVQPVTVALASSLLFCAMFAITTTNYYHHFFISKTGCSSNEINSISDYTTGSFVENTMSGVSLGSALAILSAVVVLRSVTTHHTRMRLGSFYIAFLVLSEAFVYYQLSSHGMLPAVCVIQLVGATSVVLDVTRYFSWLCCILPMSAMLGKLSSSSIRSIYAVLLAAVVSVIFMIAASVIKDNAAGWWIVTMCCGLSNSIVMFLVGRFELNSYKNSADPLTRVLLRVLCPLTMAVWLAFPAVWFATEAGSMTTEEKRIAWAILDVTLRVAFTVQCMAIELGRQEAELDASLCLVEEGRRAAVAANDAKRSIMRYLFHEVRVPLNSIVLAIDDLQASHALVDRSDASLLGVMEHSVKSISKLLDDFLSLEKAETGKLEIEVEPISLRQFLRQNVKGFTVPLSRRSLRVVIRLDPRLPAYFVADPHRLGQCVANFLSNAIKFAKEESEIEVKATLKLQRFSPGDGTTSYAFKGDEELALRGGSSHYDDSIDCHSYGYADGIAAGGVVNVTRSGQRATVAVVGLASPAFDTTPSPAGLAVEGGTTEATSATACAQWLRVTVSNTGEVITPEEQSALFTPFVQLHAGKQQGGRGSGLGLAITSQIVALHGGTVGVDSRADGITSFYLEIPLIIASALPSRFASKSLFQQQQQQQQQPGPHFDSASSMATSGITTTTRSPTVVLSMTSTPSRCASLGCEEAEDTTILIPGQVIEAAADETEARPTAQLLTTTTLRKAWIIDDVEPNRMLLARLLRRHGVPTVLEFDSGDAAVNAWRAMAQADRDTLQAVLCDKEMPGMDGHVTTATLRAEGFTGVVLAVTGNALSADVKLFMAAGANAVISKPVFYPALEAALRDAGLRVAGKPF